MNQVTLDIIGRKHTVEDTRHAFALARECGFDNINMDLIVGLPGEQKEDVRHTLEEVESGQSYRPFTGSKTSGTAEAVSGAVPGNGTGEQSGNHGYDYGIRQIL